MYRLSLFCDHFNNHKLFSMIFYKINLHEHKLPIFCKNAVKSGLQHTRLILVVLHIGCISYIMTHSHSHSQRCRPNLRSSKQWGSTTTNFLLAFLLPSSSKRVTITSFIHRFGDNINKYATCLLIIRICHHGLAALGLLHCIFSFRHSQKKLKTLL